MSVMQVQCRHETSKFRGKQKASRVFDAIPQLTGINWCCMKSCGCTGPTIRGRPQVESSLIALASADKTASAVFQPTKKHVTNFNLEGLFICT